MRGIQFFYFLTAEIRKLPVIPAAKPGLGYNRYENSVEGSRALYLNRTALFRIVSRRSPISPKNFGEAHLPAGDSPKLAQVTERTTISKLKSDGFGGLSGKCVLVSDMQWSKSPPKRPEIVTPTIIAVFLVVADGILW